MDALLNHLTDWNYWITLLIQIGYICVKLVLMYILFLIVKSIGKKVIHTTFLQYQRNRQVSANRAKHWRVC
ncbi:hypothetical protein BpJC7_21480 [Weizmannia acidilactici]|uniref:Uncharacterized protein n=1 Tax=Weizmannia acidilactici TaxID=2607726 RepID=A0A5J4JJD8_9BACI|nr:hypothetical protein [Weizmannia acidilactici]GER70845.1 hypothetical protein BpJC7_21480 [Weizmannia acidilactici]